MEESIDYGFISITQINRKGEKHNSTLEWRKGSNTVQVLGNIPHGNKIVITKELLVSLSSVLGVTLNPLDLY